MVEIPQKTKKEIIPALTGIKFLLCVLVILSNMMLYTDVNPGFAQHLYIGSFASFITVTFRVDVFFMITGFLLVHLYSEKFAHGVSWRKLRDFLIVRIARLYPLYLFVLVLIGFLYYVGVWGDIASTGIGSHQRVVEPWSWLWNLSLTTAWGFAEGKTAWNGPAWSVSAEFFNYLTFPFYLFLIARCKKWYVQLAAVAVLCAGYGLIQHFFIQDYIIDHGYGALVRANFGMLAGALIHGVYRHLHSTKGTLWDKLFLVNLAGILTMMALEAYQLLVVPKIFYMVALVAMVLCMSLVTGNVHRFLSHKAMMYLGKLSFAMYLLHQPIIRVLRYFFEEQYLSILPDQYAVIVANVLLIFAVIIFFAHVAHKLIETPARYALREKLGIKTVEVRL